VRFNLHRVPKLCQSLDELALPLDEAARAACAAAARTQDELSRRPAVHTGAALSIGHTGRGLPGLAPGRLRQGLRGSVSRRLVIENIVERTTNWPGSPRRSRSSVSA
jgi:hypothetical protein